MGVSGLLLLTLLLVTCASHQTVARRLAQEQADEATSLLLLPDAAINWDAATASLPGLPWRLVGPPPCGTASGGAGATPWKGVTCDDQGRVAVLTLASLGLQGTLPEGLLASLPALTSLDLSGNALSGSLPPGWSSASLSVLNLSGNKLQGMLPAGWGGSEGLPALGLMRLHGNNLTGSLPVPKWTIGGFATPASLEVQPGNAGLCGPVPPVDPRIYSPSAAATTQRSGTTSLILTQRDMFVPGTSVTITNWLGMCMTPCAETGELEQAPPWVKPAGLTWPPSVQTNAFDISFVFNMSISDLLTLNPGLAWLRTGQNLSLPCYPLEERQRLAYNGGDVAYGKFAGGNQVEGVEGLGGAMAAARVVLNLPSKPIPFRQQAPYSGSTAPPGADGAPRSLVEPLYWFVDLLAPFQVVNVVLTAGAGAPLRNASIYVGSDPASVTANQLVASGINVEAEQQLAVPGNAAVGRYVVVYTGTTSEGQMSLADVQVYTLETNTAANKPVTASALGIIDRGGAGTAFVALVDNNASTCVQLQADPSSAFDSTTAWAFVDLGYDAAVASVAIAAGPGTPAGTVARVYVSQRAADAPEAEAQCGSDLALQPRGWAVGTCGLTGRYVTFAVPTTSAVVLVDLCELQVSLAVQPYLQDKDSVLFNPGGGSNGQHHSGSPSGAVVAGVVLAAILLTAVLLGGAVLGLRYTRWRRRWLQQQQQVEAALEGSKNGRDGVLISPFAQASQQHKDKGQGLPKDEDSKAGLAHCLASAGGSVGLPAAGSGDVPIIPPPLKGSGSGGVGAGSRTGSGSRRESKQYSEWELVGEFAKTLRRNKRAQLSNAASMPGSAAANASLFQRSKSNAAEELERPMSTDLGTLPPGIADVSPGDIRLLECVGEGSYGQVWRAKFFGATVAVKVLSKPISPSNSNVLASFGGRGGLAGQHEELRREAAMMSTLRHPNVCRYLGACMHPPSILMEYCSRHSLDAVLGEGLSSQQAAQQLSWARLLGVALDAANGMLYLHRKGIAHRDLKSANLLVDGNWQVKVADFSFSRTLQENARASSVVMTNPRWLAPEVLNGQPGQLSADVWAFGTVMWELLTWRLPFADINTFQIIARVQQQGGASLPVPPASELPAGPLTVLPQYLELMTACRGMDPEGRPKFEAVVQQLRDIVESESRVRLAATAAAAASAASAAAAPATQQRTVRPAPRGPAYAAMAAMLKQRQEGMERAAFGSNGPAAPPSRGGSGSSALAAPPVATAAAALSPPT